MRILSDKGNGFVGVLRFQLDLRQLYCLSTVFVRSDIPHLAEILNEFQFVREFLEFIIYVVEIISVS